MTKVRDRNAIVAQLGDGKIVWWQRSEPFRGIQYPAEIRARRSLTPPVAITKRRYITVPHSMDSVLATHKARSPAPLFHLIFF